ncbi:hypothetical protein ACH79_17795 [Bradyrhizobium sp. CCBAU 051011]|jgi:hypothetical protein|uniref:hypothetical protein n=1 Tax=Bradyrhizobium sp. CCBAU 051011 TaxID=858422 RepID=UPI001373EF2C|nr:hypothetical protein [Bradyrhizobium sp. CCBAU 051011]QHO74206.1 hypothetical protein ACH79_17795 [Bradyrhizobium sp. CCBAU 051011]
MADKPNQDFGKRKPVSVPASPRPVPPPAKRSGHVALLLMGTFAVGSAAYTLMPSRTCEQPSNAYASPTQNPAECSSRSSSSSSGGGSGGGSSGRSSYYSSDSSSSSSSSHSSYDSGSHSAQRGGFGSFGHAIGFSGG